jgi:hypothetical protein
VIPVPSSLLELVGDRLAQLSARARDVVVATAALSRPTVALVRAATPGRGLDEAVTAGVVEVDHGDVRFTHPLLASAIYSQATSEERRRLHRRLARVVTDAEERARHLALGADGPDVAVAAALDEAAERARSRGAPDAAADLAEHACRLTPPDRLADIGPRCLRAAEHHFRAGNLQRARTLLEELLVTSPRGPQRARCFSAWARSARSRRGPGRPRSSSNGRELRPPVIAVRRPSLS